MLLYPRLSPQQGKDLAEARAVLPLLELEQLSGVEFEHATYAPTGGVRATKPQLTSLRKNILETAQRHGYEHGLAGGEPLPLDAERKGSFDAALAVTMHQQMRINAAEACRPGVWRFVGTILAPEFVRWRFPGEKTTHERFLGNRLRNMYGRVWWRAHLLRDELNEDDPYWLLTELGEDELVQITERPNAAGYQPLAVGIARGLCQRWNADLGVSRSALMREAMKRLLRLLPLVRFESLDVDDVTGEVDALFDETLRGLGVEVGVKSVTPTETWATDTQWQALALHRRAAFLKALSDDDVTRLTSLNDTTLPDWGEYKPRWKALFRINATAGQVLELAPEPDGLLRGDALGAWLTSEPAGSWQQDVDPARGKRLISALRGEDLQRLFVSLGWEWPEGMTHSGSQRFIRRRFSGDWATLVRSLSDDTLAHVSRFLRLDDSQADRHLLLARWLTVQPELEWTSAVEAPLPDQPADEVEDNATAAPRDAVRELVPAAEPDAETEHVAGPASELSAQPALANQVDLNAQLPTPDRRIANVLSRANVSTIGELAALDLAEIARMQGVGVGVVNRIRAFRGDVLAGVVVPGSAQLRQVDHELVERDLPDAPGLIANLLKLLEVRTYGNLFDLDLNEVAGMKGVGKKKVDAIRAFQTELLGAPPQQREVPVDIAQPASLEELVQHLLAGLNERESLSVSMRFEQGATLSELGDALGVSRERARQIARDAMGRLHRKFGPVAQQLLENANPGLAGHAYETSALGLEPWQGLFVANVAHSGTWSHAAPLLWAGKQSVLQALEARIGDAIAGTVVQLASLDLLATELDLPVRVLTLVLTRRLGWVQRDGQLVFPEDEMPRDQWLMMRLKDAGPSHQNVIGQWLMERDGLDAEEQSAKVKNYARKAEGMLARMDDAWRWDRGTFIHTAGIPVSQVELRAMVDWCVERVVGRTGPYGVQTLLDELTVAGFGVGELNHYVLKDALVRDEALIALRKGNVACANSYDEHGVDLASRMVSILKQNDTPMTFEQIRAQLPSHISYSEVTLRQRLYDTPGILKVGRGLFSAESLIHPQTLSTDTTLVVI